MSNNLFTPVVPDSFPSSPKRRLSAGVQQLVISTLKYMKHILGFLVAAEAAEASKKRISRKLTVELNACSYMPGGIAGPNSQHA